MVRLVLLLVTLPVLLLAGFGAVYYLWPEANSDVADSSSPRQHAQLLPWATEEKKAPEPKAPATRTPTQAPPAPKAQPDTAPAAQIGETKKPTAGGPGWAVNCSSEAGQKGLSCRMSQTVITKPSGRTLTNVAFLLAPEAKSPEVLLQLPLGLFIPAGATYRIDQNAPQRLSIRACDRSGCYARAPVPPATMSSLTKGKQLKIEFKNAAEKPVSIPLSLDGFATAYEKVKQL
jgi:invasion protein IalB